MNRSEFLQHLREALENDLNGSVVQDNIDYYNNYISDEVKKGREEEAIIEELGDPWMLARTVVESVGGSNQGMPYDDEVGQRSSREQKARGSMHVVGFDKWWKKVLAVIIVVLVLFTLGAIVLGAITVVAPVLFPILFVVIIFRILTRGRQ